jgi:nucleoside-diphosphate-sugar epimerase
MRVLIAGCGYVGLPLGAALVRQGHTVVGLRRSAGAATELRAAGIEPRVADITDPLSLAAVPADFDWVVNCVAASGGGPDDYRRTYLEGTRHLLAWLAARPPARFLYTSSTGVYGQTDGSTVTETSPTPAATPTAQVLIETEQLLLAAAQERGFPAIILRLAGIYGPGRGYWLKQFLAGEARMEGDGSRVLNMIHRDDVVGAILAALERGQPGTVYNVADDEPVTQRELFAWLARTRDQPLPPPAPVDVSAARKRGLTSKRVSNRRLRAELGYELRYPTFREGFAAELQANIA